MNNYRTVKDCAIDIICNEGDVLSNKEIAEKVMKIMKSDTTDKCIAWYKNKINRDLIKVDKTKCKWLNKGEKKLKEISYENLDEKNWENEAEHFVFEFEKTRTGKAPKKMKTTSKNPSGYDFESSDRHIEVKGKKKKNTSWLELTANETTILIKDPKYYLYLVEGDFVSGILTTGS